MKKEPRPVSDIVLDAGKKLYAFGRLGVKVGLPVFLGLLVLLFIGQFIFGGGTDTFAAAMTFSAYYYTVPQTLFAVLIYLALLWVLIAIPFYFLGLHFMGLGQTAKNTDIIAARHE